jgi:hypothetical protein
LYKPQKGMGLAVIPFVHGSFQAGFALEGQ